MRFIALFLFALAATTQAQPFTHSDPAPLVGGFALRVQGEAGAQLALAAENNIGATVTLTAAPMILTVGGLPVTETTATLSVRYRGAKESGVKLLGVYSTRDIGEIILPGATPAQVKAFWAGIRGAVESNVADDTKRKKIMQDIRTAVRQWRLDIITADTAALAQRRAQEDLESVITTGVAK